MKSNIYLIGFAAILTACSSPETEPAAPELSDSMQEVAMVEMPESVIETAQMEKSAHDDVEELTLRQVEAHIHGGATLSIAVDGNNVTAELETPLYNLLGFEHGPETAEQKGTVEKVEKQLSEPSTLIRFNDDAGCKAMPVTSTTELFDHDDHEDHDDHSDHRDVVISYGFTCDAPEKLSRLNADLLTAFPLMDELDVVYLGANNQASFELTPSTPTADLRP